MNESSPVEDNNSVHSDDSSSTFVHMKEKLDDLIQLELKNYTVRCQLKCSIDVLRIDLENLHNTCQRFDGQIRKHGEILEDYYEKSVQSQKSTRDLIKEKLDVMIQQLEELNSSFCEAFNDYSSDVLINTISYYENEIEQIKNQSKEIGQCFVHVQQKARVKESLMKLKPTQKPSIEVLNNAIFELSMKRPEIKMEENLLKQDTTNKKLEEIHGQLARRFNCESVVRKFNDDEHKRLFKRFYKQLESNRHYGMQLLCKINVFRRILQESIATAVQNEDLINLINEHYNDFQI